MTVSQVKVELALERGKPITSMERIYGGGNNRVYRLTCGESEHYAAKIYPKDGSSTRDRAGIEFTSVRFLWNNGEHCVPKPVAVDRSQRWAIYEYIDGRNIPSSEVTESDIDHAVQFLLRLNQLSPKAGNELPTASDASFSPDQSVESINGRLDILLALPQSDSHNTALREFLVDDFSPALDKIGQWCQSTISDWGMPLDSELAQSERTLNPSDFGFHNALKKPDGQITYLDFEYFGWDDPAKMISDFLLHPGMDLSKSLKRRFVAKILPGFAERESLKKRLQSSYPLFALKWCLIVLNEFLPEKLSRRRFADDEALNQTELQSQQLAKAKRILQVITLEYQDFPYDD